MKTSITLQKEVADKIQESADKIYWNRSQVINILLAYSLGLQYPELVIKEIIWEQHISTQPQQNTPDCDKKIKRMQKIMEDREASADETIDKMWERLEVKDKTIWQLELKIYNLENELEEKPKTEYTSKEWYKFRANTMFKYISCLKELVKKDDDPVLARNLKFDIKYFKKYFWVEPEMKNLDDLDKLVDHYLAYKKKN